MTSYERASSPSRVAANKCYVYEAALAIQLTDETFFWPGSLYSTDIWLSYCCMSCRSSCVAEHCRGTLEKFEYLKINPAVAGGRQAYVTDALRTSYYAT